MPGPASSIAPRPRATRRRSAESRWAASPAKRGSSFSVRRSPASEHGCVGAEVVSPGFSGLDPGGCSRVRENHLEAVGNADENAAPGDVLDAKSVEAVAFVKGAVAAGGGIPNHRRPHERVLVEEDTNQDVGPVGRRRPKLECQMQALPVTLDSSTRDFDNPSTGARTRCRFVSNFEGRPAALNLPERSAALRRGPARCRPTGSGRHRCRGSGR